VQIADVGFELSTIEVKRAAGADIGHFTGMASTFGNTDLVGDIILPGAFAESLRKVPPARIKMLWQHDVREPIGVWDTMTEMRKGLQVEGRLVLGTQRGREAFELLRAKAIDGLSIGFSVPAGSAERDRTTGIRKLKAIDLLEVSVVTFPANLGARVANAKAMLASGDVPDLGDCERLLHAAGFTRRQAKALLADGYRALAPEAAEAEEIRALLTSLRRATEALQ